MVLYAPWCVCGMCDCGLLVIRHWDRMHKCVTICVIIVFNPLFYVHKHVMMSSFTYACLSVGCTISSLLNHMNYCIC